MMSPLHAHGPPGIESEVVIDDFHLRYGDFNSGHSVLYSPFSLVCMLRILFNTTELQIIIHSGVSFETSVLQKIAACEMSVLPMPGLVSHPSQRRNSGF